MKIAIPHFQSSLALVAAALLLRAGTLWVTAATINIDAAKAGPRLNPRMYGIFLEEINHGVDGGLYAELIRNRAFEDAKPPEGFIFRNGRWVDSEGRGRYDAGFSRFGYFTNGLPFWSLVQEGGAEGSMSMDMIEPLNDATPRSLRLDVADVSTGRLGIANDGFWGIGVQQGEQYNLSFWARAAEGFSGPLMATLEEADGSLCSQPAEIKGIGRHWKQFHATLTATKSQPRARFVLAVGKISATPRASTYLDGGVRPSSGAASSETQLASPKSSDPPLTRLAAPENGRTPLNIRAFGGAVPSIWFDMVSLFPGKTFRGRPNGLRPDLAQMLAELKPGFVRFPGGCVVEGGTIETSYNWKKTVGPLEQREEVWGPWEYRRTHGMGFHEYLQFCEDIGAEPLYVGFAGETCMFRHAEDVPMEEMGWVVSNFLDSIEYANGPVTTRWGKLRAQQGHPEPFGLKTVEVGNENGTENFPPRYRMVHDALKQRYPELKYIADMSFPRYMSHETSDMEDNHFYNSPQWFMNETHHYDKRDRNLPPVYDGEVAVTSGEGGRDKGNMIAALAEGAFLVGLERNADVVRQVSYAPLLANVRGRTDWHGMVYFDTTRAFGTVSYYLWKLFGQNRPAYTVQTEVQGAAQKVTAISGAIGVGTWLTSSEFKDIRVEKGGEVLYASDFSKGAEGWRTDGGNWSVAEGAYRQGDAATGLSFIGEESWSDYTLTLKARKLNGAEGFLIAFGGKGQDRYWWNVGGWGNTEHAIEFNQNPVGPSVPGSVETGRWYDLKVELSGARIRCYMDGKLVHDESVPAIERVFAIAGRDESGHDLAIKVINASSEPVSATLDIQGVGRVAPDAEATVLTSARASDNNSMDNPAKIVPVTIPARIDGPKFTREFPAYSFTLLKLKTP